MIIKRIQDALAKYDPNKPIDCRPSGEDIIPGTNKRRTFVSNENVYSHESDLEKITNKQYRAAGANLKKKV